MFPNMRPWHPESRIFTVDGVRAHAVVLEPRRPSPESKNLLLLHGIAQSSWAWRKNLESLAEHHRVIALCQKGHGWSDKTHQGLDIPSLSAFVLGAMDRLELESATFVGSSLGGGVSLWTSLVAGDRVDGLVLVNPASHLGQLPWPLLKSQVHALAPVYRALVGPTLLRIPLTAIAYRNLPIDRDYMAGFWAPFTEKGSMRSLVATARSLPASIDALDQRLSDVDHPTLVIWGERDGLLSPGTAHRLVRKIPRSRLVLIPEAGHCPHEETPDRFNRLVLDFIAEPRTEQLRRARPTSG